MGMNTLQNENVEEEPEEYPGFICMLSRDVYMNIHSMYSNPIRVEFRYLHLEQLRQRRREDQLDYRLAIAYDDESIRWCFNAEDIIS